MPIKPENRAKYPPEWPAISARIRRRAGGQCECLGECGVAHGAENVPLLDAPAVTPLRCAAVDGLEHPVTRSRVVLTVAHLDHEPAHCDDENLRAMCQRCHNRYDGPHRRANAARTRRARKACGDLFEQMSVVRDQGSEGARSDA